MNRLLSKWVWGFAVLVCSGAAQATDAVVTVCDETHFNSAFSTVDGGGGGKITFTCGGTITFTSYKQVSADDVIDGSGHAVIIDGGSATPFFQVYASASLILKNVTLSHGKNGAAHPVENFGELRLDGVTATNNNTNSSVVHNYGTATVVSSTFASNTFAAGSDFHGTAINNDGGSLVVQGSTFTQNVGGGAIYSTGELHVVNSTFQGNSTSLGGGAIYQSSSADSSLDFITVSGNSAAFGAGIYNDGGSTGTMTVGKSIFAGNSTGNCDGVFVSGGYNLANDTGCGGFFGGTDTGSANLPLGALANNGGPTKTMTLSAGNAAINKIPAASCTLSVSGAALKYDQRWETRATGVACDAGAYQHGSTFDRIFSDEFGF
jgi:hypothetical protein